MWVVTSDDVLTITYVFYELHILGMTAKFWSNGVCFNKSGNIYVIGDSLVEDVMYVLRHVSLLWRTSTHRNLP